MDRLNIKQEIVKYGVSLSMINANNVETGLLSMRRVNPLDNEQLLSLSQETESIIKQFVNAFEEYSDNRFEKYESGILPRITPISGKPWQDVHGAYFDPNAVKQLERIIDATDADIVVESSWKYLGLDAMKELWKVRNLPGRIIDITPSTTSDEYLLNVDLDDFSNKMHHCKGLEISSWLSEKGLSNTRYVIIDDEYVILDSQLPHFILTNPYEGITEEQANRAISMLNE